MEKHQPWVIPFRLLFDQMPSKLATQRVSGELSRSPSLGRTPVALRVLDGTPFFKASTTSAAEFGADYCPEEKPTAIVFVHFDVKSAYAFRIVIAGTAKPGRGSAIIAHGCEICRFPTDGTKARVIRETILKGAHLDCGQFA